MSVETIVAFVAFLALIVAWIMAPAGSPLPEAAETAPAMQPATAGMGVTTA
jgi:hypothetical protein